MSNRKSDTTTVIDAPATVDAPAIAIVRDTLSKQYANARSTRGRVKERAIIVTEESTGKLSKSGNVKGREASSWEGMAKTDAERRAVSLCREVEQYSTLLAKLSACRASIAKLTGYGVDEITPESLSA